MKPNIFISAACVLAACGCAGPLQFGSAARSPEGEQVVAPSPASPAVAPQAKVAPPEPVPDDHPAPDAFIKLKPGSDHLTGAMEARLARIAQQARENEQLMLRLESYVPDGGSHALNLGLAEQALQVIRKRLVELSVSPRRIFLAPFGEEHREERDRRMHWVEIYLVRPRL